MEKIRESQDKSKYRRFLVDVDDFKIVKQIESGGFSLVYSVENIHNGKKSAAKVLNVHSDEEKYKKMINTEISVLIRLHHPTIIKFHGYSIQDFNKQKNVTIFMELAKKGSLAEFLKKIQLGLSEEMIDNTTRQIILVGIARGMMYLHQHKLIHRDLKPGNILLDDQLRPYITDFGLSKLYENGHSSSQSQQCGTSMYMAPEVIEGTNYNGKADVYSFGILMFEIVTDSIPYPLLLNGKLTQYKFNKKVVEEDYRPEFKVPVKKSIENLIKKCWSKDPKERPTFESIFKKLAYNLSDSIEDIYDQFDNEDEDEDENCDYYLDNVDVDAVLLYADEIDNINHDEINSKETFESLIDPLKNENLKLKEENEQLKKKLDETNNKIDLAFNSLKKENEELKVNLAQLKEKIDQIQNEKSRISKNKFNIQEFNYQSGKEFDGIMKYLTAKTGGNIHDNGTIEITSNSVFCDCYPRNAVDYQCNDNCYHSKDEPNTFICFDLKDCRIQLSSYSIKSCQNPKNSGHLRNWIVEVSNDSRQWAQLDKHSNDSSLNGSYNIRNFRVANERDGFYRFIRLRQTGYTWYAYPDSHYYAYFIFIEFFGKLREPTSEFYNDI